LTAKYIIFETTTQIPEVEYGGKYGHMRANTDICPVLLAIIEHAKTNIATKYVIIHCIFKKFGLIIMIW
jgi:hypothetical protein